MSSETFTDALSKVWVIIPAAGVGKRMQSDIPKQYLKINNKTILEHTIARFSSHPEVAGIIVALHSDDPYWNDLRIKSHSKPLYTVEGGKERSDSVMQALSYLSLVEKLSDDNWVMVHDAARPNVNTKDIDQLLAIRSSEIVGGILASPVRDTMKRSNEAGEITVTESRENLWHALTPQMFRLKQLSDALEYSLEQGLMITDEASALENSGESPLLIEAEGSNIKITHPDDLALAEFLLLSNKGKY